MLWPFNIFISIYIAFKLPSSILIKGYSIYSIIMLQYFTIYVKWWTNELIKEDNITIQIWLQKYISVVMYNHTKNIYTLLRMLCDTPILSINRSIIRHSTVYTLAGLGHPSEWVQKQILQNILGRVQDLLSNCVVFYKLCNIVIATMLKTINVH